MRKISKTEMLAKFETGSYEDILVLSDRIVIRIKEKVFWCDYP